MLSANKRVEFMLREYPRLASLIKHREEELRYPLSNDDENIGGGRAQFKETDVATQVLIAIDSDPELADLKNRKQTIERCLAEADEDTKIIIEQLYFKRYPKFNIMGLVNNNIVNCGRDKAYKLRNKFIEYLTNELNLKSVIISVKNQEN